MRQPGQPTDSELIRRTLTGDRTGFDELVERHYGLVYSIALGRLGNAESARDLAQEVFLRAFLHLAKLRDREKFTPWLAQMTRNLGIQWIRGRQAASRLIPLVHLEATDMENIPDKAGGPGEGLEREEEALAVREAVLALPPNERELVLLHHIQGRPKNEIASQLGVHPATVGRSLDRALARMKPGLAEKLGLAAPGLNAPERGRAETLSCIALAAALSPVMRETLAMAAFKTAPATAAHYAAATPAAALLGSFAAWLQSIKATVAAGASIMGMGKTAVIGGTIIAAVIGVAALNMNDAAPPAPATSAMVAPGAAVAPTAAVAAATGAVTPAPAQPAGPDALTLTLPKTPGEKWRTTSNTFAEEDGVMQPFEKLVTLWEYLGPGPDQRMKLRMTIEDFTAEPIPNREPSAIKGRRYLLTLQAGHGVESVQAEDGLKLAPADVHSFAAAMQGLCFTTPPPVSPVAKGAIWNSDLAFSVPDQPDSRLNGTVNLTYAGMEERNGRRVAILKSKNEVKISNLLVSSRQRGQANVAVTLNNYTDHAEEEAEVDPATGRFLRRIGTSGSDMMTLDMVLSFPKMPNVPPQKSKIQEPRPKARVEMTFEYL